MANVLYGMRNTHKIKLNTIIQHSISVKKGVKKSLLVVDMPKGSYRTPDQAKKNAKLIFKKTKCDAVKIESNNKNFKIIKEIKKAKIPVMGHIGFTPQFNNRFKVKGKNTSSGIFLSSKSKSEYKLMEVVYTSKHELYYMWWTINRKSLVAEVRISIKTDDRYSLKRTIKELLTK